MQVVQSEREGKSESRSRLAEETSSGRSGSCGCGSRPVEITSRASQFGASDAQMTSVMQLTQRASQTCLLRTREQVQQRPGRLQRRA